LSGPFSAKSDLVAQDMSNNPEIASKMWLE
jgi:hypothetical protein